MSRSYEFSKAANSQPLEVPWGMEGVTPDPAAWRSDRMKESGAVNPTVSYEDTPTETAAHFKALERLSDTDWNDQAKVAPLLDAIDGERIVVATAADKFEEDWEIANFTPPKAGKKDKEGNVKAGAPLRVEVKHEVVRDDGSREEVRRSIPIAEFIRMQAAAENAKRAERLERVKGVTSKPTGATPLDAITSLEQNADNDAEIGDALGRKYLIRRFRRNIVHRIVELDGKSDLSRAEKELKRVKRRRDAATNPALRALRQRDVDLAERIKQGAHNRLAGNDMQQHEYLAGLKHKRSDALAEKRLWGELRGSQNATRREARQIIDRMPREQRDRIGRLVLTEYAADRKQHRANRPIKKLDKAYNRSEKKFEKAENNHREAERAKNRALNEIANIEATRLPTAERALDDAQQAVRQYLGHDTEERTRRIRAQNDAQTELQGIRDELTRLRKVADEYREKRKLERAKYNHYKGQAGGYDQQREAVQYNNDQLADALDFAHLRANQQAEHGYYVTGRRIAKRNEAIRRAAAARRLEAARVKAKPEQKPETEEAKPKTKAKPEVRGKW